jgi:tRNA A64-2'-O-ribosylphosphate transferase
MEDMPDTHAALQSKSALSMQDAFTKTVPIWCAVLNRAVWEVRHQMQTADYARGGFDPECSVPEADLWDCDLHVPAWVSENEATHIRTQLTIWSMQLLQASKLWTQSTTCHAKRSSRAASY